MLLLLCYDMTKVIKLRTVLIVTFCIRHSQAKCILVAPMPIYVSVCVSLAAFPHYCMYQDVAWGNGRGCPLVVHYWAYLQLMHGFLCSGNICASCEMSVKMLVLAVWLVHVVFMSPPIVAGWKALCFRVVRLFVHRVHACFHPWQILLPQ